MYTRACGLTSVFLSLCLGSRAFAAVVADVGVSACLHTSFVLAEQSATSTTFEDIVIACDILCCEVEELSRVDVFA